MNIHLGTGGEPQANQMSNPLRAFSHSVGHFMLKCGKPFHPSSYTRTGGLMCLWASVHVSNSKRLRPTAAAAILSQAQMTDSHHVSPITDE